MAQFSDSASDFSESFSALTPALSHDYSQPYNSQSSATSIDTDDRWEYPITEYLNQAHANRIDNSFVKEESPSLQRNRTAWIWQHMSAMPIVSYKSQNVRLRELEFVDRLKKRWQQLKGSFERDTVTLRRNLKEKKVSQSAKKLDPAVLEKLVVRLLAQGGTPMNLLESDEFKALLMYLDTDFEVWAPSANTAVQWVVRRKFGPYGKAHNNITKIRASAGRIQNFRKLSGGALLPKDNRTRWNSAYTSLTALLKPSNRTALIKFYQKYPDVITDQDRLTDGDWNTLEKIHFSLQALYDATQYTEEDNATLDRVLPTMEFILAHFESGKIKYADDEFLSPCINSGWAKLNDYYGLTDNSPAHVAAVVLDPTQKWQYFEEQWSVSHPEWLPLWKGKVRTLWEDNYKGRRPSSPINHFESSSQGSTSSQEIKNSYIQHLESKRRARLLADEYNVYLSTPPILSTDTHNPRSWWLEKTQQQLYPNLSRMALDILSIPAMSAEAERVFSYVTYGLDDRRCSMKLETLEALVQLNSWLRMGKRMEETIIVDDNWRAFEDSWRGF